MKNGRKGDQVVDGEKVQRVHKPWQSDALDVDIGCSKSEKHDLYSG